MRIAEVAPLYACVPPDTYGGTERIVHALTETLVEQGHQVTLFAAAGSRTRAELRPMRHEPLFATWEREPWRGELAHAALVGEVLEVSAGFDIVHFHLGSFSLPFAAACRAPSLHSLPSTVHPDVQWMIERFPRARITARSHNQIEDLPEECRNRIGVVYNGVDFDRYTLAQAPGQYLVFLGRIAEEKGPVEAIDVARAAGLPIILAGEPHEARDEEFFEARVRPLIDGKQVRWAGPVDDAAKNELLRHAAALLFPIQWDEPFGIVMIEAMACGVPVLACSHGSVPEVIDVGITGYYADSPEELAALLPAARVLERSQIRNHARRRFSRQAMTESYLKIYESVAESRSGN